MTRTTVLFHLPFDNAQRFNTSNLPSFGNVLLEDEGSKQFNCSFEVKESWQKSYVEKLETMYSSIVYTLRHRVEYYHDKDVSEPVNVKVELLLESGEIIEEHAGKPVLARDTGFTMDVSSSPSVVNSKLTFAIVSYHFSNKKFKIKVTYSLADGRSVEKVSEPFRILARKPDKGKSKKRKSSNEYQPRKGSNNEYLPQKKRRKIEKMSDQMITLFKSISPKKRESIIGDETFQSFVTSLQSVAPTDSTVMNIPKPFNTPSFLEEHLPFPELNLTLH